MFQDFLLKIPQKTLTFVYILIPYFCNRERNREMKNIKIELKWAILFTISYLTWMLLEKTLGWHDEKIDNQYWLRFFYIPISILFYFLALKESRRRIYQKQITWLQAFWNGLLLAFFIVLLIPVSQYIIHTYLSPEFLPNMIQYSVKNDLMTVEEANAEYNLRSYIFGSMITGAIAGTIASGLVAIFVSRLKEESLDDEFEEQSR